MDYPGSYCLYITTAREEAKKTIWPGIQDIDKALGLNLQYKQNTGEVVLPNGSQILLQGAGSKRECEKARGKKYPIVVIDEAQNFGDLLHYLINEIIEPATLDYQGQILLTGTPNAACAGPFFEVATGIESGWNTHSWTWQDNPHLPESTDEWLNALRERRGWTETTPAYLREYMGRWIRDDKTLVFDFRSSLNTVPKFDISQELSKDWEYVLGVDIGFNDPTAFCVLAYSYQAGQVRVVESYKEEALIPSEAAARVEEIRERFPINRVVVDTGGIGKGYAEEFQQRFHIPVKPAKKTEKATYLSYLNGDFRTGALKIAVDKNSELLDEVRLLQWDLNKLSHNKFDFDKSFQDHLCDAMLYAWRECRHHGAEGEFALPTPGTPDYWKMKEQELWERVEQGIRDQKKPWWQRL